MVKRLEIAGEKYNRLTAVRRLAGGLWEFQCDCGNIIERRPKVVRCGNTKSCGCYKRDQTIKRSTRHGQSQTQLYYRYAGMIARCTNPKNGAYVHYGARGIKVCERWRNSFEDFIADMGYPKPGESIDRIDVNGNYEPENCRWATRAEQSRNTRRNVVVEVDGISLTIRDWEIKNGVNKGTYQRRANMGWSLRDSVTLSVERGKSLRSRK